jgi:hypothetical protein
LSGKSGKATTVQAVVNLVVLEISTTMVAPPGKQFQNRPKSKLYKMRSPEKYPKKKTKQKLFKK